MSDAIQTITAKPTGGNLVALTPEAVAEVKRLVAMPDHHEGRALRLGVKGGGCSGLSYLLKFDEPAQNDHVLEQEGVTVVMDRKSAIYLKGLEVHFQSGLEGKGFVFRNPNASNTCGCGESFSV